MNLSHKRAFGFVSLFVLLAISVLAADAYTDDKKNWQREREHRESHNGEKKLNPIDNATYADQCGSCHFAYQPELLPAASWQKILNGTDDHFGEAVPLDGDAKTKIINYLISNAADTSSAKLSARIMRCLKGSAPVRITDIPYIRKEHHEITPEVVQRKSVGSLSNCIACHRTAAMGEYDDDDVSIPQ